MDVTCERCKAEYEFDEALLGEKGTTVKCSACGHVFRVMPPRRDLARSNLLLRYASDGSTHVVGSLRELQQRIRAGEVSLDDELGREGFPFRSLREVPELKNFFSARAAEEGSQPKVGPERTTVKPDADELARAARRTVESDASGSIAREQEPRPARAESTRPPQPAAYPDEPPARHMPVAPVAVLSEAPAAPVAPEPATRPTDRAPSGKALAKNTMLGVGPSQGQLPPPPRMPTFQPPVATPEQPPDPHSTLRGRPVSYAPGEQGAPLAPSAPAAGWTAPQHAHASFSRGGTFSTLTGVPEKPVSASHVINAPTPTPAPAPSPNAASTDALVARLRAGNVSAAPVASKTATREPAARKLYLDDSEAPPPRVEGGSSKTWLSLLLLVGLGAGGWYGWRALEESDSPFAAASASNSTPPGASTDAAELATAEAAPEPAGAEPPNEQSDDTLKNDALKNDALKNDADKTVAPAGSAAGEQAATEDAGAAPANETPTPIAKPSAAESPAKPAPVAPAKSAVVKTAMNKPEPGARPVAGNDYSGLVTQGDQLFTRGDHDGAQRAFRAALAMRPSGSEANAGLGFTLLSQGKAREALPFFDSAASSGFAEANIGLGDAYRKLGQPSSAIEAYQGYLDRLSKGSRADYARGQIEKLRAGASKPAATPGAPGGYRPAGELSDPTTNGPPP